MGRRSEKWKEAGLNTARLPQLTRAGCFSSRQGVWRSPQLDPSTMRTAPKKTSSTSSTASALTNATPEARGPEMRSSTPRGAWRCRQPASSTWRTVATPASRSSPPTGAYCFQWGSPGSGNGQFNNPSGKFVGPDCRVYVADTGNRCIQVFSANGAYQGQWERVSGNNGPFFNASDGTAAPDGTVHVADIDADHFLAYCVTPPPPYGSPARQRLGLAVHPIAGRRDYAPTDSR